LITLTVFGEMHKLQSGESIATGNNWLRKVLIKE
jgi:hypothetical protein